MKTMISRHLILMPITMLCFGCTHSNEKQRIDGNREYAKIERNVGQFNQLELNGDFDLELIQKPGNKLMIDADSNLHNYIYTETQNGKLIISQPENRRLRSLRTIKILVETEKLSQIIANGRNKITTVGQFNIDSLRMEVYGATTASLNLSGNNLSGLFPGASDLFLEGKMTNVDLQFPGAANLDANSLNVKNFKLKLQGAGKANILVTNELSVEIAGAGLVSYTGNPSTVNSSIDGIGKLRKLD